MASVKKLNPNADITRSSHALLMNISAAKGLQSVLRSNLGPKGTMKMLVGGAGDIKLTKDGNILLHEMQIQHPTASLIARAATAQDDITGDGTSSSVLIIGEALKQCERFLSENVHPRVLADGFDAARAVALKTLDAVKLEKTVDKELLLSVARTSLRTKVPQKIADQLTEIVTDAVLCIQQPDLPLDLFMVEVMTMQHRAATDTRLVKGLVLDHGPRHPRMPTKLENCHILTCNISLEFEKSEVNAGFFYRSAAHRQELADAERKFTDLKVKKIIELKREVCKPGEGFVVVNMKGIDPVSLDMLANENILALRRAKRRNMERLTLSSGGSAVNSEEGLTPDVLGFAKEVTVHTLGEEKFTFVEGVANPRSCTILIKGPDGHTIAQIKDAVRDGLRAVKNTVEDKCVVPGGGAFEIAAHRALMAEFAQMKGRTKLGVQAFADALLIIPKTLAANSGFDPQDTIISLMEEHADGHCVGVDVYTGEPFDPDMEGVYDNYRVKRQQLQLSSILASQLLLVDEVMRAGKSA
mmetsp:Transcript_4725/g.16623  ORF Transcript_4725/g.16623 Transcript_4725/m.16623 type:complete len:527 (-) Transcript_4725:49-1629(-)|eukprot:CAMPEP_0114612994 /NCGR_PEP_ID=MMETSP0168-20121206/4905_1 /TAXON_ID=95228 ORGANISM="Vannella sp., Strain DIVA3 517/6/12" /NCGR_SAMPLE_ID=MMETSP0168 /ASSEMBLY_ACC=CAM_ASM_000044 /LENGTH=526 /DNA_ID=CAMNT_0001823989 /DNA_START=98 /DNA_END=1678 /DNA_ORIENTATION=+